jgi:secretion/DNA translocation related TadE-like protein
MPAAATMVGVMGVCAVLVSALATVGAGAVHAQRIAAAADAAALAAADAASGAVSGVPCDLAGDLATVMGATLEACEVDVLVATVTVSGRFGVFPARASARAGPPPPTDP